MSFPRYSAYKDSGVEWLGQVPGHWTVAPLKYRSSFNDEILPETTPEDLEIEYVEISDVDAIRGIVGTSAIDFGEAPSRARRLVKDGDVLVSTVRTYLCAIAPVKSPPENMVVSTGFAVVRPRHVDSDLLGYICRSEYVISEIISRSVGVSYPAINASDLMRVKIAVPENRSEQSTVAAFLDRETGKIDALVAEQEKLIALLKEKRQAFISYAVTKGLDPAVPMKDSGIEWLGEVPAHWTVQPVKYVVRTIEQGWSPQCEGRPVSGADQWGVLKVGCVNGGKFDPNENKLLPEALEPLPDLAIVAGDLLVSRANTRDLVGSAAVAPADYPNLMLCDKLYRLRLNESRCTPGYLALFLGINGARGQIELGATGASDSMQNIAQSTILNLMGAFPPIGEQQLIESFIDRQLQLLQNLELEAQRAIDLLEERRSALISAAVTGKIDVRGTTDRTLGAA